MALVRVYCGLASTQANGGRSADLSGSWLTVAVVDDSGRLLDVCDISDDPAGYVELGAILAERSGGFSGACVATDTDEYQVTLLLAAAGSALAVADEDTVDDYAERFGDDESAEELAAPPSERRAIGLARALQAGALAATVHGAPRELLALKPVLAAHGALATGRHAAAVALREVLRELYPAALRAYPDPADPIPLAVLDALPEPGMLGSGQGRGRDASVIAALADAGVADAGRIGEAVTALRVAITETPRRTGIGKSLTLAIAESIRQAVAAVRAFDTSIAALVGLLAEKSAAVPVPAPAGLRPRQEVPEPTRPHAPQAPRRSRPVAATVAAAVAVPAVAVPAVGERAGRPVAPAGPVPVVPVPVPVAVPAAPVSPAATAPYPTSGYPTGGYPTGGYPTAPYPANEPYGPADSYPPAGTFPQSEPYPPAGRSNGFPPAQYPPSGGLRPAEPAPPSAAGVPAPTPAPTGRASVTMPSVAQRFTPRSPAPGSRADWPLNTTGGAGPEPTPRPVPPQPPMSPTAYPSGALPATRLDLPPSPHLEPGVAPVREGRVPPPWLDDLPSEPPVLRLVEPAPLADRALLDDRALLGDRALLDDRAGYGSDRDLPPAAESRGSYLDTGRGLLGDDSGLLLGAGSGYDAGSGFDGGSGFGTGSGFGGSHLLGGEAPVPEDSGDDDLLIFAQTRSAWFSEPADDPLDWGTQADVGWQAAERAAQPVLGDDTSAGLPRRVPQANLVPGSPLPPSTSRGLRVVRDAAAMAAHTTGYFQGSRRGEEVRGFAVGGRPGRETAAGWDFARDGWEEESDSGGYEYRSAVRH